MGDAQREEHANHHQHHDPDMLTITSTTIPAEEPPVTEPFFAEEPPVTEPASEPASIVEEIKRLNVSSARRARSRRKSLPLLSLLLSPLQLWKKSKDSTQAPQEG